jgi:hypothetical protein
MKIKELLIEYDHWALLSGLVILISTPIWSEIFPVPELILNFATLLVIFSGISVTSGTSPRVDIKIFLGIVAIGLTLLLLIFPESWVVSHFLSVFKAIYFITLSGFLLKSIFVNREVQLNTIINAITGYILLSISFAIMSGMWNSFFPGTFNFRSDFTQNFSNEIYFSVVTMTTLGYGDLLPLTNSGKSWSVLMAITGSFYSTVVLALIVGKFIASKDR